MKDAPRATLGFGPYTLDSAAGRLLRDGQEVALRPKAYALLQTLVARPGALVGKDELLDAVWGRRFVSEGVVKTTVAELRAALGDDPKAPRWIHTVARRGYRFDAGEPEPQATAAVLAASPTPLLIGREPERVALRKHWDTACAGQGQVLALAGDPGIGKSALLTEFMATLDGARMAMGQCVEAWGGSEPYLPVLDALDQLCAREPGLPGVMREVAPTWLAQLPWRLAEGERATLQQQIAAASQDRMLRELAVLLERLTRDRPLLLVIEDVHWADPATVQWIGALARRTRPLALMLLLSFRPIDLAVTDHPFGDLRRELRLHGQMHERLLEGLSVDEVGTLLQQRHGADCAEPGFIQQLHEHTEGLPLFVLGVLDELVAEGAIVAPREPGRSATLAPGAGSQLSVPRTLADLIERQLQRLPAPARTLLETAALAGPEVDHLVLAEALAQPADAVREQLEDLVRRRIWLRDAGVVERPDGRMALRCAFGHVLVRHALVARAGGALRIERHRQFAAALERGWGERSTELAAVLALHHEEGQQPASAARHLAVAARTALQRYAPREALARAERGLALLEAAGDRTDAPRLPLWSARLVATLWLDGMASPNARAQVGQVLARLDSLPVQDDTLPLWQVALLIHFTGRLDTTTALIHRFAERAAGAPAPAPAIARNAQAIDALHAGRLTDSAAHFVAALALPGAAADGVVLLREPRTEALSYLGLVAAVLGEAALVTRCRTELEAVIARGTDLISFGMGRWFQVYAHYFEDDAVHAHALASACVETLEARRALPFLQPHRIALGWARAALGDAAGGAALAEDGLQRYLGQGSRQGVAGLHAVVGEAHRLAGDAQAARRCVEAGFAVGAESGEGFAQAELYRLQGAVECLADPCAPAAEEPLRRALAVAREQRAGLLMVRTAVALAGWLVAAGQRQEAQACASDVLGAIDPAWGGPLVERLRGVAASAAG